MMICGAFSLLARLEEDLNRRQAQEELARQNELAAWAYAEKVNAEYNRTRPLPKPLLMIEDKRR